VLAAWQSVAGASHSSRVVLSTLLSSATLVLLYGAARRRLSTPVAASSVAVLAVNPFFVQYGGSVAAEMPYMFCSVVCLYGLIRSDDARHTGDDRASRRWFVAAVVATLAASLMRSVGLALIGALVLWLLFVRRSRTAIGVSVAVAVPLALWIIWTALAPEQFIGRSYVADILDFRGGSVAGVLRGRITNNAWIYATQSLTWVMALPTIANTAIDNVAGLLIVGITLLSGLYVFSRQWRESVLYMGVYGLVVLAFRWQATRFLVPLTVLLVPCMLTGAAAVAARIRPRSAEPMALLLALLLVYGGAVRSAALVQENSCARIEGIPRSDCTISPAQARYFDAIRFIGSNLPEDAVLLTVKSGALYYYTGRRSITPDGAREQHPDEFITFVKGQGAGYILLAAVDDIERSFLAPLIQANCGRVRLVQSFPPSVLLFALEQTADPAVSDGSACEAISRYRALNPPLVE
jgi:hypothetical protein